MRPVGAQEPLGPQASHNLDRHAVAWSFRAPARVPEMVDDEFQQQARGASGEPAPGRKMPVVGGERPQRVIAHAFAREMLERRGFIVPQQRGELIVAIKRHDGV